MNNILQPNFASGICAVCRKRSVERWCDYIIKYHHSLITLRDPKQFEEANRRGTQYETCDLPMCTECAKQQGGDTHLCPHHHSLQLKAQLPNPFQRKRQTHEKWRIAQEILGG